MTDFRRSVRDFGALGKLFDVEEQRRMNIPKKSKARPKPVIRAVIDDVPRGNFEDVWDHFLEAAGEKEPNNKTAVIVHIHADDHVPQMPKLGKVFKMNPDVEISSKDGASTAGMQDIEEKFLQSTGEMPVTVVATTEELVSEIVKGTMAHEIVKAPVQPVIPKEEIVIPEEMVQGPVEVFDAKEVKNFLHENSVGWNPEKPVCKHCGSDAVRGNFCKDHWQEFVLGQVQ